MAIHSNGKPISPYLLHLIIPWQNSKDVKLTLPIQDLIESATAMLKRLSSRVCQPETFNKDGSRPEVLLYDPIHGLDHETVCSKKMELVELKDYNMAVINATVKSQALSAFNILRGALSGILGKPPTGPVSLPINPLPANTELEESRLDLLPTAMSSTLKTITKGLLYAMICDDLSDKEDSKTVIKGLFSHVVILVALYANYIEPVDPTGKSASPEEGVSYVTLGKRDSPVGKLNALSNFGLFRMTGPLTKSVNPFVVNEALCDVIRDNGDVQKTKKLDALLDLIVFLGQSSQQVLKKPVGQNEHYLNHLLFVLCKSCTEAPWNLRSGLFACIYRLAQTRGHVWAHQHQDHIIHTALYAVKSCPLEIPSSRRPAVSFLIKSFSLLYGVPNPNQFPQEEVRLEDSLAVPMDKDGILRRRYATIDFGSEANVGEACPAITESVMHMLLLDLPSSKNVTRFAVRHCLLQYCAVAKCSLSTLLAGEWMIFVRKALLTRPLRSLPLPEQVAVVETLAFLFDRAPMQFPLTDHEVLALLSELLKLTAIADGAMAAKEGETFPLVDKNGYVSWKYKRERKAVPQRHVCSMFLGKEIDLTPEETGGILVNIPADLPMGVQLRVAALILFRAIIRRHTDPFFDPHSANTVGNIRPHVISLLFRSLVSNPPQAVAVAHSALQDVLTLDSAQPLGAPPLDPSSRHSRLPKELLQACIKPVLLDLRDYTKLTLPLLRGLARLLSLLATWFNKTLGDKLLEHLGRWLNPDKISSLGIWNAGEEQMIAAAMIDLFDLLPQGEKFVEGVIKTVIKLEASSHQFSLPCGSSSPYRAPLTKYCNRYFSVVLEFFLTPTRLNDPIYSALFQDILNRDDAKGLREGLANPDFTRRMLSVCFEKPLAMIRSEKASSASKQSRNATEILTQHGIPHAGTQLSKEASLQAEVDSNQKQLLTLQEAESQAKAALQMTMDKNKSNTPTSMEAIHAAKRKHSLAQQAYAKADKALVESKRVLAVEVGRKNDDKAPPNEASQAVMTRDSLELQYQGFLMIDTLVKHDPNYLTETKSADVVRTYRWLWHSKGRHLRLLHEELLPVKYQLESKFIASALMTYSSLRPSDADILFDLLRIFLEQTSVDFSRVKRFLEETVSNKLSLDDKKNVFKRFFNILGSDRPEETKVLSIHYLVLPLLRSCLRSQAEEANNVIDGDTLSKLVSESMEQGEKCGERLQIELLMMLTILIEERATEIGTHKKELIKFGWGRLKSEDSSSKLWAYVNVCTFISKFETPSKLTLQVYFALFKSYQQEAKDLVRQSLEILVPCLTIRLTPDEFDQCMKDTRKVMYEEGHGTPQLIHMLQIVVRHPDVFFGHRHLFVQLMANSLHRLGLAPNSQIENRALALSICDLLFKWADQNTNKIEHNIPKFKSGDKRKAQSTPSETHRKKIKNSNASSTGIIESSDVEGTLNTGIANLSINFLIRLAILTAEAKDEQNAILGQRSLKLLDRGFYVIGSNVEIEVASFEKIFSVCSANEINTSKEAKKSKEKPTKVKGNGKSAKTALGEKSSKPNPEKQGTRDHGPSSKSLQMFLDLMSAIVSQISCRALLCEISDKVCKVLHECFYRAHFSENSALTVRLEKLVIQVVGSQQCPVVLMNCINQLVEEGLRARIEDSFFLNLSEGNDSKNTYDQDDEGTKKSQIETDSTGKTAPTSPALMLRLIESVVDNGRPSYVENFCLSISQVAHRILSSDCHVFSHATTPGASGGKLVGADSFATPVIGILEEALRYRHAPSTTESRKASVTAKRNLPEESIDAIVSSIRLLGNSSVPRTFSRMRKEFFRLLNIVLDAGDNIKLLATTIALIGKWIHESGGGPLTTTERNSFLVKMAVLDSRFKSGIDGQLLYDLLCNVLTERVHPVKIENPAQNQIDSKSAAISLFSPNETFRTAFISKSNSLTRKSQIFRDEKDVKSTNIEDKRPDRLSLVLQQLMKLDTENSGNKFLPVSYAEQLLILSKASGCLKFCSSPSESYNAIHDELPTLPSLDSIESSPENNSSDTQLFLSNFHGSFLRSNSVGSLDLNIYVLDITNHLHSSVQLSHKVFGHILRSTWNHLVDNSARDILTSAFEVVLTRPYHLQFLQCEHESEQLNETGASRSPPKMSNVVKALIDIISTLDPVPFLDLDVLLSCAKKYSSWSEVISILDQYYVALEDDSFNQDLFLEVSQALQCCFVSLGSKDMDLSVAIRNGALVSGTKQAMTLDLYGRIDASLSKYQSLMEKAEAEGSNFNVSLLELSVWEDRWVDLNKESCQWEILSHYTKSSNVPLLTVERAWKSRDWPLLRQACSMPSIVALIEEGDPVQYMNEIFLTIADGNLENVENLHAQTSQLCLYQWQLRPKICTAGSHHVSLFQMMHRLVETRESGQVMVEAATHSKIRTLPNLKNLLTTWRERIPNEFESISVWEDLFTWRAHVFSAMSQKFQWSDPSQLAGLHDRPWTAIQMARVARKQGMKDSSLLSLSKLTDCAMDVSDAFSKLREQIVIYKDSKSLEELKGGLNMVNTTNLSYFDSLQKSELFRLKASFLNSLGARAKSNHAYCQSLQICPTYAKSWLSWGELCTSLAELTEKQSTSTSTSDSSPSSQEKKAVQYLAQAMGCYLEAMSCGTCEWARVHIPRCIWMLRKESTPGLLCQTFDSRSKTLPEWVWLPWIPQLLTSLGRSEAPSLRPILKRILLRYPQALYFGLRAFYLERRDIERAHRSTSPSGQQSFPAVAYAEDLMSSLRRAHSQLWASLEAILEELIIRFRPSLEEELLNTIKALLQRGKQALDKGGANESYYAELLANFRKTLNRVGTKFFNSPVPITHDTSGMYDYRAKLAAQFSVRYKKQFDQDFMKSQTASDVPWTLQGIVQSLAKWQEILDQAIAGTPACVPLHQVSPVLLSLSYEPPDLWEGACDPRRNRSSSIENDSVPTSPSSSAMAASAAASAAAKSVASQAAAEGIWGDFGGGSASVEIFGQYAPYCANHFHSKPKPELTAKLVRFESSIEIKKTYDEQQLVRWITMCGSDGINYRFMLQFNGSYFTRADEHCAQAHFLLDKALRKGIMSSRKHLSFRPNTVVPIAQRLRMIADHKNNMSLKEILVDFSLSAGKDPCEAQSFYTEKLSKIETSEGSATGELKLKLYLEMCETRVMPTILQHQIFASAGSAESIYFFRKNFSCQLALASLMQHAMNSNEVIPSRVVFNVQTGQVIPFDFRLSYNNQGLLDGNSIPFRMTRNISTLIGTSMREGVFIPTFTCGAEAMSKVKDDFRPALCLILRDDIVSWYCSKSPPRSDVKNQELERQLGERILKNVSICQKRFSDCSPDDSQNSGDNLADAQVRELLSTAISPEILCHATPVFQAWL